MISRREFITLLGGAAAAWPLAARAQQAMPVVGFLGATSPDAANVDYLRVFRQGLKESGYVEGENVAIEYRWADESIRSAAGAGGRFGSPTGRRDRRDRRPPSALAAKAATTTIPIVFTRQRRPGQAWSCRQPRPAGRQSDRDQFFHVLSWRQSGWNSCVSWCPRATRIAVLVNPANTATTETTLRDVEPAARAIGLQIQVLNASTSREIDAAFATIVRERPDALFVGCRPILHQPACPIGPTWRRATRSPRHFRAANLPKSAG